jgi:hypothetical protein
MHGGYIADIRERDIMASTALGPEGGLLLIHT